MAVVYADGYAVLVCGGGETAMKAAAVNTLFAPLSPPPTAKTLCHKRIGRLLKNDS
jgi:hypothetical protein